jgi:outer membrane lipoprotein-sorting protein
MKMRIAALCAVSVFVGTGWCAAPEDVGKAMSDVQSLAAKVKGFRAVMEVHHVGAGQDVTASATLTVSRELGWKLDSEMSGSRRLVVNDFRCSYEYFPDMNRVLKYVADSPEVEDGFRKPSRDMTPLGLLDPKSLKLAGTETLNGESVYHFEGTTLTLVMAGEPPVKRRMELWLSNKDGLPRKTVEELEESTGTTVYRQVQVDPELTAKDFKFEPPKGAEVIDMNAEMKKAAEREQAPAKAPARR